MVQPKLKNKILQTVSILVVLLLFYAALWVLRREVKTSHYQDVLFYIKQISNQRFLAAIGFSLLSYFVLTFYDFLGLRHIGKRLAYWKMAITSFIAYSFSHNIGASVLTSGSIRYRLYSAWGLSAGETATIILICGMTFWTGFTTMGAVFFFLEPPELPASIQLPFNSVFTTGVFCLVSVVAYLLSAAFIRKTITIMKWKFPTPSIPIVLGQMLVGSLDWICSGSALYMLLPPSSLSFPSFMAIYLIAQIAGFASQVPGGLGILETVVVFLLAPEIPAADVLGALLVFRVAYYLIPFVLGLFAFITTEIARNREGFKRGLQILNRLAPDFAPHLFAVLAFAAGALLLASNSFPEVNRRMVWLNEFMPLSMLESSHFITSLLGAALLVAARGLQQRLESSYFTALVLLGLGTVGCLFKGFNYHQAVTLLAIGSALIFCRRYFPRKGSVFHQRYPAAWVTAILFIWLGSIWAGILNYRYEQYSHSLWTTFDLVEDPARFLRGSLGATLTLFLFSVISLFSPTQPETEPPGPGELEKSSRIAGNFRRAYAWLALLGDKSLLFNRKSDAFLMYAIEGKSWVALGDPVGGEKEQKELSLKFNDLCRRYKAWPVFFGVGQEHSQFYLDLGLTAVKIGEEARVPMKGFQLDSLSSGDLKNAYQKTKEKADYSLEMPAAAEIPALLPELKKISEEWLSKNKTREKGFLTCFFRDQYLLNSQLAIVRNEGKIAAFATLFASGGREEAATGLLRSSSGADSFLEDYLKVELLLWAKEKGYQYFNLGIAPLLDTEQGPLAHLKGQLAEILSPYVKMDSLQDIRKEKERYNPLWEPKYLAVAGNLPLTVAFNNIRSLVDKGGKGVEKK
jgi:phosphatidylglycerol lysyltransferase